MKLTMKIDWFEGLEKNKEFLKENEMWEHSFDHSTFYRYYHSDEPIIATTVQCFKEKELVGVMIFPHLPEEVQIMTLNKQKFYFSSVGEVQIYIKPKYRGKGFAKEILRFFNQELKKYVKLRYHKEVVCFVQSVQDAVPIVSKYMNDFVNLHLYGYDPNLSKEMVRNASRYHIFKKVSSL